MVWPITREETRFVQCMINHDVVNAKRQIVVFKQRYKIGKKKELTVEELLARVADGATVDGGRTDLTDFYRTEILNRFRAMEATVDRLRGFRAMETTVDRLRGFREMDATVDKLREVLEVRRDMPWEEHIRRKNKMVSAFNEFLTDHKLEKVARSLQSPG